jgi:hypothetical protein
MFKFANLRIIGIYVKCAVMTRNEAIAIIEQSISSADEATLAAAAQLFKSASADPNLPRPLTAEDLALIEQAREDFKVGRTYTSQEVRSYLAERRAQRAGHA